MRDLRHVRRQIHDYETYKAYNWASCMPVSLACYLVNVGINYLVGRPDTAFIMGLVGGVSGLFGARIANHLRYRRWLKQEEILRMESML